MPKAKRPPFLAVDLNFMEDEEVRKLSMKFGRGAAMLWLEILMKFQKYEKTDYMVPLEDKALFCEGFFMATGKDVADVIAYAASVGWLKLWTNDSGDQFFYNERRQIDLLNQKVTRDNRTEGAGKCNSKRNVKRDD